MKPFWKWLLVLAAGAAYFVAAPAIYQGLKIGEHPNTFDAGMTVVLTIMLLFVGSVFVALFCAGVFAVISWLLDPEEK